MVEIGCYLTVNYLTAIDGHPGYQDTFAGAKRHCCNEVSLYLDDLACTLSTVFQQWRSALASIKAPADSIGSPCRSFQAVMSNLPLGHVILNNVASTALQYCLLWLSVVALELMLMQDVHRQISAKILFPSIVEGAALNNALLD